MWERERETKHLKTTWYLLNESKSKENISEQLNQNNVIKDCMLKDTVHSL